MVRLENQNTAVTEILELSLKNPGKSGINLRVFLDKVKVPFFTLNHAQTSFLDSYINFISAIDNTIQKNHTSEGIPESITPEQKCAWAYAELRIKYLSTGKQGIYENSLLNRWNGALNTAIETGRWSGLRTLIACDARFVSASSEMSELQLKKYKDALEILGNSLIPEITPNATVKMNVNGQRKIEEVEMASV